MHTLTYISRFDVFCGSCRFGAPASVNINLFPHYAAMDLNLNHTKHYEYHETIIGFIAAA
ncbi:hypothetical protein BH10ACI3_BH10ACI3_23170 [soil metagenome]